MNSYKKTLFIQNYDTIIDISMYKHIDKNTDKNIFILSQLSLQTDLIMYMIEKEINVNCHIYDQELNIFPDNLLIDGKFDLSQLCTSIILIDREIHSFKTITKEISNNNDCSSSRIALFNVNEHTIVDKDIFTKQIRGIFYKDDHLETFLKGIKAILRNEVWISRETLLQYIFYDSNVRKRSIDRNDNLTKREIEILTLVSMGATNDEIADKVFISTNTVKTHLYNIFKKIDVQNRIQAALWAAKKL